MRYLKRTFREFVDDDCPTMAAALAYYTVFSLPPLLVIIITTAGFIFGAQTVQSAIQSQASKLIGEGVAQQVYTMVQHAGERPSTGIISTVIGVVLLLVGATGVFGQLQASLNKAWSVMPDPNAGGVWSFLTKRVLSFGMILGVAFLLMVSLSVSAVLSAMGGMLQSYLPGIGAPVLWALDPTISFLIIAALFAAIFKVLPDAEIRWRDVAVGALLTAALFVIGKFALGFYLGRSDPAGGYGAAGSVVLILLWTYYASMIVLIGAEFTQVWAEEHGAGLRPGPGAIRVERTQVPVRDDRRRPAA
ncbi:MAG TPA: YihY/virulence factor BrkB family protein [Bryobacteraceae bacterium]|nr:YihY/virulence factor BrkB family protein [Bryobacteraceae bacterium]